MIISITVTALTTQKTSVSADSNVRREYIFFETLSCFNRGITNAEEVPPKIKPVRSDIIKVEPAKNMMSVMIPAEMTKLKMVNLRLGPNSFMSEDKLILNAPSKRRKRRVNVVNSGARSMTCWGVTKFETFGPMRKPIIIRKRTSGNFVL